MTDKALITSDAQFIDESLMHESLMDEKSKLDLASETSPAHEVSRLKDVCQNCNTPLQGKYCYQCGQPTRSIIKFIGEVVYEVGNDIVGYDSRLKHTIFPLLFIPGKLSLDYIRGKIFYYVLPIRLYLIMSVICILLVQMVSEPGRIVQIDSDEESAAKVKEKVDKIPQQLLLEADPLDKDLDKMLSRIDPQTDEPPANQNENPAPRIARDDSSSDQIDESSGYFDFDYEEKDDTFKFNGAFYEDFPAARQAVMDIVKKSQGWKNDPAPLVNQIFEIFPIMMFILLPIYAVFLKLFYLFKKRFYLEHLIFCLHNHCFIYFAIILEIGLTQLAAVLASSELAMIQFVAKLLDLMGSLLMVWIMVYIVIAVKRFYQQNWPMTLVKVTALGFVYCLLLSVGIFATALIGAWKA